ncbi:helix-turn-helix domain-containing protein [Thiococcus pfennigii]|uniref:helix-turn-helix domain-containing protein n=1 Tax=Thiococcus pfennigii TaxID=1057 RepID=UPI0019038A18|nr:helix-turn-helix domain-containing protein [Thiococcus pfennigii]MBK1732774.1 hypothetical protein [Thiococcus pfennigii]
MSYRLTDWALHVRGLTSTQKLVLVALASHCNGHRQERSCWPSMAALCELTALSDRAIRKALAELERRGLIERRSGSGKQTTVYRLVCEGVCDAPDPHVERAGGVDAGPSGGAPRAEPGSPQDRLRAEPGSPQGGTSFRPGRNVVPPRAERGSAQGGTSFRRKREEKREGKRELNREERQGDRERVTDSACAREAGTSLSAPQPLDWEEIAARIRPDLPDPALVRRKFEARHRGRTWAEGEEARAWELWLLRERVDKEHPGRHTEGTLSARPFGTFLDIVADYEVIHDS